MSPELDSKQLSIKLSPEEPSVEQHKEVRQHIANGWRVVSTSFETDMDGHFLYTVQLDRKRI